MIRDFILGVIGGIAAELADRRRHHTMVAGIAGIVATIAHQQRRTRRRHRR